MYSLANIKEKIEHGEKHWNRSTVAHASPPRRLQWSVCVRSVPRLHVGTHNVVVIVKFAHVDRDIPLYFIFFILTLPKAIDSIVGR